MNQRWFRSYITVAQCGSISKAAEKLFISSQALLQQINSLEEEVGVRLLDRTRHGVTLTLAGEEFLKGTEQMLALYQTTLNKCHLIQETDKVIRIPMLYGPIYSDYMEQVCNIYSSTVQDPFRIEFIPSPEGITTWIDNLCNLRYDLIEMYTIDGICPKDLYFEPLNNETYWCLMNFAHPLTGKEKLTLYDLDGHDIATTYASVTKYMQLYAENIGIHLNIEEVACERSALINACNKGAVFFVNYEIATHFPNLYRVPLDFDLHVQHGLACRAEMKERYEPFFAIAKQIGAQRWK